MRRKANVDGSTERRSGPRPPSRAPVPPSRRWPSLLALVVAATLFSLNLGQLLIWIRDLFAGPDDTSGQHLEATVTDVRDGDTIEVGGVAVRLANLDCAERGTAQGEAASARMRELVAGEVVACWFEGRRSYDQEVGTCALASSGTDLGEILIAESICERWRD